MPQGTCSVDGCGRWERLKRGWCSLHYQAWRKHGDPLAGGRKLHWPEALLARMEPRPNGCIWFTGHITRDGYGLVWTGNAQSRAHRAAYEHFVGPIPEGMTIDHECHNGDGTCAGGPACLHRRCVNVEHMAVKTRGENTLASPLTEAGRHARQTHCVHGHEFTPENTYTRPGKKWRQCRACKEGQQVYTPEDLPKAVENART